MSGVVLLVLLLLPVAGGVGAWLAGMRSDSAARWTALLAMLAELVLAAAVWVSAASSGPSGAYLPPPSGSGPVWIAQFEAGWVPGLGISFHLAVDGLSLPLVALTAFLGVAAVVGSWTEVRERVGLFHLTLLAVLAGTLGVFIAADLFVFYFFWELMLVPMYYLIGLWGHEDRRLAATKFFLFTQLGGMLLLIAVLGLYVAHSQATGVYTFDLASLLDTPMSPGLAMGLMLGFVAAFAVKLPAVPLHTWLPDAHTQAPTAGSVVLAGLLLKTAAYGFIRYVLGLFPGPAREIAPYMVWIGVAGILYGALLAFGQRDLKRLVAYTSVSHMGFVLVGVFVGTRLAITGAVLEMLAHGVSTGSLFLLAGAIMERTGTRDIGEMGGAFAAVPRLGAAMLVFTFAAVGLPGLGNFVAEFMVLAGTFPVYPAASAVAAAVMVVSAVYGLWMLFRVFGGPPSPAFQRSRDLGARELAVVAVLIAAIVWLGLYPQPVVRTFTPGLPPAPLAAKAPAPVPDSPAEEVRR